MPRWLSTHWVPIALGTAVLWAGATVVHSQTGERATLPAPVDRRAAERLQALIDEADQLALQQRGVLGQLRQLELARQIAVEELRQADAAVAETESQAAELETTIEQLEIERDALRPAVESRLVEMYKLGRGRYTRLLLSTSDLRRFGQVIRTVAALSARDEARFRTYERQLRELGGAIAELTTREEALARRRATAARARGAAEEALAKQNLLVRDIDARRDLNAQLTSELQETQRRLESTLRDVSVRGASGPLPIGPLKGSLPWPTEGAAQRPAEGATAVAMAQRPGVEIVGPEGSPVRAVYDGRVAYAGSFDGLGNLVIVDHGGQTFTLYGYLQEFEVAQGTAVVEGQHLGRVGASPLGKSSLYFELRVSGRPVDPLQWLAQSR